MNRQIYVLVLLVTFSLMPIEASSQGVIIQALNRFLARRLLAEKIEAQILKRRTEEQERIARLRKQKRKRSKRAQEKVLRLKRLRAEKKLLRQPPEE